MQKITFNIMGLAGNTCVERCEKNLMQVDGVAAAQVDLKRKCATVSYDELKTEENDLLEAVINAGYGIV